MNRPTSLFFSVLLILFCSSAFAGESVKLKVASFPFKPLIYQDTQNISRGINADLLNQIAKENNWSNDYVHGSWSQGLEFARRGNIDLLTSVMYSKERDQYLDYSKEPVFVVWGEVYSLPDTEINDVFALAGKSVAIMRGDLSGENFRKLAHSFQIQCDYKEVSSHDDVFKLIQQKEVSAGVAPNIYGILNTSKYKLVRTSIVFNPNPLYFAVPQGMHSEVLETIDRYLSNWRKDRNSFYYKTLDFWLAEAKSKNNLPKWLIYVVAGGLCFVVLIFNWNRGLTRAVSIRTNELRESESRYRSLFQDNYTIMLLIDPNTAFIVDANPAACEFYGYSREEFCNLKISEINVLSEKEIFQEMELAKKEKRNHFHFIHRLSNGEIYDVEVYSGLVQVEGRNLLYSTVYDVTERKNAEKKLKASEQNYKLLADFTHDWEYWINPRGEYVYISPAYERLTGYTIGQLIADPQFLFSIISSEHKKTVIEHYSSANMESPACTIDFSLKTKSGEELWIEHNCVPVYDELGNFAGRRGNNRDITQRIKAEQQRDDYENELRQKYKMEAIGVMAGGMAHNFNNNLAIILGNLELSKRKLLSEVSISGYLDNAKVAAMRARDLISKIMTFSRKEAQRTNPIRLSLIVDETIALLESTIPSSVQIKLQVKPGCVQSYIMADASQIQEILLNLCSNAIHAMDEVGGLILSLDQVELEKEDIPVHFHFHCQPGTHLRLSVQDNGKGIPPEIKGKIFDPFFTTKELHEGTGMGLSTVQGIVEQCNGMVSVDSTVGRGTTFHLFFPIVDPVQETVFATIKDPELYVGTEQILFIDDNEMLAKTCQQMLSSIGYQVTVMTDSCEAKTLFNTSPNLFDLVISDQTMPELTGIELLQEIKKIRPEIPTILCTGFSSKIGEQETKVSGINAFLTKPIDFPELLLAVRQALGESTAE